MASAATARKVAVAVGAAPVAAAVVVVATAAERRVRSDPAATGPTEATGATAPAARTAVSPKVVGFWSADNVILGAAVTYKGNGVQGGPAGSAGPFGDLGPGADGGGGVPPGTDGANGSNGVAGSAGKVGTALNPNIFGPSVPGLKLSASLPTGTKGKSYSGKLAVTGGTAPYHLAVTAGKLPTGLSLNSTTGAVTGKPTTAEAEVFTVQITDSSSPEQVLTSQLRIVINA